MKESSDNLSLSLLDRARDRIVSSLLEVAMPVADSPQDLRLPLGSPKYRLLEWLAGQCGFDRSQVQGVLREGAGRRALWNLLKSVSDYGVGTPQTLRAPVSVVWSLSYGCNLRCMHCYQNASRPSPDELTLEEQLGVVDQMAQAGVSMIVLSGGEPLTNPHLSKLIERIRTYDIAVSIDSNGVLMNRAVVESLKRAGVASVELSLDSINPGAHDRFRGLDGAFEKTLNALDLCSEAGIFTTVATTTTAMNYADSSKLIALAKSHGADRVVFFDLIPAGRGRSIEQLRLSQRQLLDLMALVKRESTGNGIEVFTELPQFVVYSSTDDEKHHFESHRQIIVDRKVHCQHILRLHRTKQRLQKIRAIPWRLPRWKNILQHPTQRRRNPLHVHARISRCRQPKETVVQRDLEQRNFPNAERPDAPQRKMQRMQIRDCMRWMQSKSSCPRRRLLGL